MLYIKLFICFFLTGLFSFGGGYASIPLMENQVVELHRWLSPSEFVDLISISQMAPGSVALNAAAFVGLKTGGAGGAAAAVLGCMLPSCVIVVLLARFYGKYRSLHPVQGVLEGLRPAVAALIASAGLSILLSALVPSGGSPLHAGDIDWAAAGIFLACFFILRKWKPGPVPVMLGAGAAGFCISQLSKLAG